jgi:hypothetical protein
MSKDSGSNNAKYLHALEGSGSYKCHSSDRREPFAVDVVLQPGAYITDGVDLYEVKGIERGVGFLGIPALRVVVENCRNLGRLEFMPDRIRRTFRLVREAPTGDCPDLIEEIAW